MLLESHLGLHNLELSLIVPSPHWWEAQREIERFASEQLYFFSSFLNLCKPPSNKTKKKKKSLPHCFFSIYFLVSYPVLWQATVDAVLYFRCFANIDSITFGIQEDIVKYLHFLVLALFPSSCRPLGGFWLLVALLWTSLQTMLTAPLLALFIFWSIAYWAWQRQLSSDQPHSFLANCWHKQKKHVLSQL